MSTKLTTSAASASGSWGSWKCQNAKAKRSILSHWISFWPRSAYLWPRLAFPRSPSKFCWKPPVCRATPKGAQVNRFWPIPALAFGWNFKKTAELANCLLSFDCLQVRLPPWAKATASWNSEKLVLKAVAATFFPRYRHECHHSAGASGGSGGGASSGNGGASVELCRSRRSICGYIQR